MGFGLWALGYEVCRPLGAGHKETSFGGSNVLVLNPARCGVDSNTQGT